MCRLRRLPYLSLNMHLNYFLFFSVYAVFPLQQSWVLLHLPPLTPGAIGCPSCFSTSHNTLWVAVSFSCLPVQWATWGPDHLLHFCESQAFVQGPGVPQIFAKLDHGWSQSSPISFLILNTLLFSPSKCTFDLCLFLGCVDAVECSGNFIVCLIFLFLYLFYVYYTKLLWEGSKILFPFFIEGKRWRKSKKSFKDILRIQLGMNSCLSPGWAPEGDQGLCKHKTKGWWMLWPSLWFPVEGVVPTTCEKLSISRTLLLREAL